MKDEGDLAHARPDFVLLETQRTILRPFTLEDATIAYRWFSDPEVMHFIPGGPDRDLPGTHGRLERYISHQRSHGFSKWAVIDRATQEIIGDSGLFHLPDGKRIELGFRFRRDCWARGYASEVGLAWIGYYMKNHPGRILHAIVHPQHQRSQRVIRRLGFTSAGSETIYEQEMMVFALQPISTP